MNKIFLVGRLGEDPTTRQAGDGTVTSFSLAENSPKRKDGTEQTNWFRCSAWRALGETCAKYLHKGDQVTACGTLMLREFVGKDGQKHLSPEITLSDVEFHRAGAASVPTQTAEQFTQVVPQEGDELPF